MILLTRDAGQGKTNFLCDFTENYLLKKKIVSIYYNAFEFCERPVDTILRKLTCDKKYELQYIKKVLSKRWNLSLQPIIIIIDGLNENTTLNNFGKYMEESLAELMSIPSVKIIMTSRNELLEERFGGLCCETLGATFCSLNMRARGEEFGERIFQGYLLLDIYYLLMILKIVFRYYGKEYVRKNGVFLREFRNIFSFWHVRNINHYL